MRPPLPLQWVFRTLEEGVILGGVGVSHPPRVDTWGLPIHWLLLARVTRNRDIKTCALKRLTVWHPCSPIGVRFGI